MLSNHAAQTSDIVITMGCGDTCPYFPGVSYRDWKLDDPGNKPLDVIRTIRDDISDRVRALITELTPANTARPAYKTQDIIKHRPSDKPVLLVASYSHQCSATIDEH